MAIEYPLWNDRLPEVLVRFGPLVPVAAGPSDSPDGWTRRIESALEATQDALARSARRRDPSAFETLIGGTAGVGGFYDLGRRLLAPLRGIRFSPDHQARQPSGEPRP
jgi:hypothetical protein